VRRLAVLFLLPFIASSADLAVDHVTVTGTDLKAMEASLAAVGIRYQYGGPHSNHATEMALTSFPDGSYLELMGIQPNADPQAVKAHYWSMQLQGNAGPTAWAVRPDGHTGGIAAEVKRLQAAGVMVSEPERSGRARPDGVRLEWEASRVGAEPNGTFFPFLIHDFTPREQRAFPTGSPTVSNFRGVTRVIIAVRDLNASTDRYRKAYNLPAPRESTDAVLGAREAIFSGTPVILATPLNAASWITTRLAQFGEGPCAFVLGSQANKDPKPITWLNAAKLGWHLGVE